VRKIGALGNLASNHITNPNLTTTLISVALDTKEDSNACGLAVEYLTTQPKTRRSLS
jgi:hypothetical protein